jgi:hypothetical protein
MSTVNSLPTPDDAAHRDAAAHESREVFGDGQAEPVPPNTVVVEVSTCSKASKMRERFSSAMPQPVSPTTKRSFSWRPSRLRTR